MRSVRSRRLRSGRLGPRRPSRARLRRSPPRSPRALSRRGRSGGTRGGQWKLDGVSSVLHGDLAQLGVEVELERGAGACWDGDEGRVDFVVEASAVVAGDVDTAGEVHLRVDVD